jgi:hypothetical protein
LQLVHTICSKGRPLSSFHALQLVQAPPLKTTRQVVSSSCAARILAARTSRFHRGLTIRTLEVTPKDEVKRGLGKGLWVQAKPLLPIQRSRNDASRSSLTAYLKLVGLPFCLYYTHTRARAGFLPYQSQYDANCCTKATFRHSALPTNPKISKNYCVARCWYGSSR